MPSSTQTQQRSGNSGEEIRQIRGVVSQALLVIGVVKGVAALRCRCIGKNRGFLDLHVSDDLEELAIRAASTALFLRAAFAAANPAASDPSD